MQEKIHVFSNDSQLYNR